MRFENLKFIKLEFWKMSKKNCVEIEVYPVHFLLYLKINKRKKVSQDLQNFQKTKNAIFVDYFIFNTVK